MMEIKWILIVDKNGGKSEPILHYWDKEWSEWVPVRTDEVKDWNYEEFLKEQQ